MLKFNNKLFSFDSPNYTVTVLTSENGFAEASTTNGWWGTPVSISSFPNEGYYNNGYDCTGCFVDPYGNFILTADTIIQPKFSNVPYKTLTLFSTQGGTLTANTITGFPGDKVTLLPENDTYYRFSNYEYEGDCIINGNELTFGYTNANVSAIFNPNVFSASGGFEQGSNVSAATYNNGRQVKNIDTKYAIVNYTTDNVPTSWYATSNRWKPNDISSYKLSAETKMKFAAKNDSTVSIYCGATGCVVVGSTTAGQQTFDLTVSTSQRNRTAEYDQPFTTTSQNINYGVSASVQAGNGYNQYATAAYIATGNTGTWTATGIAP